MRAGYAPAHSTDRVTSSGTSAIGSTRNSTPRGTSMKSPASAIGGVMSRA